MAKYKTKRSQIFRKRLKVPNDIKKKVYDCKLTIEDVIKYNIQDMVDPSCFAVPQRNLVYTIGVKKAIEIDTELYKYYYDMKRGNVSISTNESDFNDRMLTDIAMAIKKRELFYYNESIPQSFRDKYGELFIDDSSVSSDIVSKYYSGCLELFDLIENKEVFAGKSVVQALTRTYGLNTVYLDDEKINKFVDDFSVIFKELGPREGVLAYCLNSYSLYDDEDKKKQSIADVFDAYKRASNRRGIELSLYEIAAFQKVMPIVDIVGGNEYAKLFEKEDAKKIAQFGLTTGELSDHLVSFIETYGIDNIMQFDKDSGGFFSSNNFYYARNFYEKYMHYSGNGEASKGAYLVENKELVEKYSIDQFYEIMRRMIAYGPTDPNYEVDYSTIKGRLRDDNPGYFIADDAPEELKKVFYSKKIKSTLIKQNPTWIKYLANVNLDDCIGSYYISNDNGEVLSLFSIMDTVCTNEEKLNFFVQYGELMDKYMSNIYSHKDIIIGKFNNKEELYDSLFDIFSNKMRHINEYYSQDLPFEFKNKYPDMFLSDDAPTYLKNLFYSKTIFPRVLKRSPEYVKHLMNVDYKLVLRPKSINVHYNIGENMYETLHTKYGIEAMYSVVVQYGDLLDLMTYTKSSINIANDYTNIDEFKERLEESFYKNFKFNKVEYSDKLDDSFKSKYPDLFLPDDAPVELKEKFYNKKLSASDFKENSNWYSYFLNTDLSIGLTAEYDNISGLLANDVTLFFINSFENNVYDRASFLNYYISHKKEMMSVDELKALAYSYFVSSEQSLSMLMTLNEMGFENEYTRDLNETFTQFLKSRPELDIKNPALSAKLLQKAIVDKLGTNVLNAVLDYNTGAHKAILNCFDNGKIDDLSSWVKYIQTTKIYDKKILHFALLSYGNSVSLSSELCANNVKLTDEQEARLFDILTQKNKYGIGTIAELDNYSEIKKEKLLDRYNGTIIDEVKDSISEMLFNVSFEDAKRIVKTYGLSSPLFVKNIILKEEVLSLDECAMIKLIDGITSLDSCDGLRSVFEEMIFSNNAEMSLINVEQKMKKLYNDRFRSHLFIDPKVDSEVIKHRKVDGLSFENMNDKNGIAMDGSKPIDIVELNGIDFKLFIHKLHNFDPTFNGLASKLERDPSLWNKTEGASTISTSMISETHMECVRDGDINSVYYGFNDISDKSILLMGTRDIYVEHGGAKLEPRSHINDFMMPDTLQMLSKGYNEVALARKSSNNAEFDSRLQPNCIISFTDEINDNSKRAAQYFDVPIYIINRTLYNSKRVDELDLRSVLYAKNGKEVDGKCETCLSGIDEAYKNQVIDEATCATMLNYVVTSVSEMSVALDVSKVDLEAVVKKRDSLLNQNVMNEEVVDGKRR